MNVDELIERFPGAKRNGTGWTVPCPAHEDHHPSLSISEGNEGRVLINCHAGCPTDAVLAAVGLAKRDLFATEAPRQNEERRRAANYDYYDANGDLVSRTVRYQPKGFSQCRPDGAGGWIWNLTGVELVLYNLPAVIKAVANDEPVYVVEGEKDVETLRSEGVTATCNPMGARKWPQVAAHAALALKGAEVKVIADADTPGREHAREVKAALTGHAASVTVLEPPSGKDVSEMLANGHTLDELVPLVDEQEPAPPTVEDRAVRGGTFVLDAPAQAPAVWGSDDAVLCAQGEPTLIAGPTGVGKTTLVVQFVAARAGLRTHVLGLPVVPDDRPVLYLAMDRPPQIARAMARLFTEKDRATLDKRLIVWRGPLPMELGKAPDVLLSLVHRYGAGTVIIDSLKDAVAKLTDDESANNYNRAVQAVCADGVEVIGLHHQRKGQAGAKPKTLEDVYGSTWITAGSGSVILLWGQAGDPIVEFTHLKQPAGEVGPWKIEHDHLTGLSTIHRGFDALAFLRNRPNGATATEAARAMLEKDPNDNERRKAQRVLDGLVKRGLAHRDDPLRQGNGGTVAAQYHAVDSLRIGAS